jgi:hypothetical protein
MRPGFGAGIGPAPSPGAIRERYGTMTDSTGMAAAQPAAGDLAEPGDRGYRRGKGRETVLKNVFVFGLNDFNRSLMERLPGAAGYRIHGLVPNEAVEEPDHYDVPAILAAAETQLDAFDGPIDAIVGYIDIPVGTLLPILGRQYDVPTPSLESVLKCQHKYWSRVEQAKVIPQAVPRFARFDPFDDDPLAAIDLDFPFWIKPVKSAGSYLGFRIDSREQFFDKLALIRAEIGRLSEPFNHLMGFADLPADMAEVDCHYCIAEEIIGGHQCTLEGFVHGGEVTVYGVIDSVRYPGSSAFLRYEYPSKLPAPVQARTIELTQRVLAQIGLDHSTFNVEYFWDEAADKLWLLEINTRISQSHSDLFFNVDGASNHLAMIEIGLGRRPNMPFRKGAHARSAKWYYRRFEDAYVEAVPGPEDIAAVQRRFPEARVQINVHPGMRLSQLVEQDSYSFDLAWLFLGGADTPDLESRYREALGLLPFRFSGYAEKDVPPVNGESRP